MFHPSALTLENQDRQRHITEIIIPGQYPSDTIVFPLVSALSQYTQEPQQRQWLTWITHRRPTKRQLARYQTNLTPIRIIHVEPEEDCRWILWEALHKGNSHTVITETNQLSQQDIALMERAVIEQPCTGIIIKQVTHSPKA